jgi:hypothetical protein
MKCDIIRPFATLLNVSLIAYPGAHCASKMDIWNINNCGIYFYVEHHVVMKIRSTNNHPSQLSSFWIIYGINVTCFGSIRSHQMVKIKCNFIQFLHICLSLTWRKKYRLLLGSNTVISFICRLVRLSIKVLSWWYNR